MTTYVHTINPQIAAQIGESESILLNQIDYWLSKSGKSVDNLNGKWIYNSHKEWLKQFSYWSLSKLRRTIKSLENLGLIISVKVNSKKWNQTKWYSIDYEKYAELFKREYLKSSNSKLSITEKEQSINKSDCLAESLVLDTDRFNSSHFIKNKITKSKNSASKVKKKISKKESEISKDIKLNIHKNTSQSPKVCICSKWTNQSVQNEQMLIVTNNIYTNTSSNELKNNYSDFKKEEDNFSKKIKEYKSQQAILAANENNLLEQMVYLWNKVFEYSLNPIKAYANQKNTAYLLNILHKYFNNDLNKWREYAIKVNSSKFLMGEKETKKNFKATFGWLIKPETIEKIINDEYGVGDRELDMNNLEKNIKEKEYDIRVSARQKVSQCLKDRVDKELEEQEFKEYLLNERYEEDGDQYKVKNYMEKVSKYQMYGSYITPSHFYYPGNEKCREKIFNAYLMNKYLGVDELEIQERIKEIRQREGSKNIIFEKMKKLGDNLKNISLSNTGSLERMQNDIYSFNFIKKSIFNIW